VRIALTVLALVLDVLCLILMVAVFVFSHPSASAKLGVAILAGVIAANLPALIWSLVPRRPPDESVAQAGIFS
jgi:hypothetical protein